MPETVLGAGHSEENRQHPAPRKFHSGGVFTVFTTLRGWQERESLDISIFKKMFFSTLCVCVCPCLSGALHTGFVCLSGNPAVRVGINIKPLFSRRSQRVVIYMGSLSCSGLHHLPQVICDLIWKQGCCSCN